MFQNAASAQAMSLDLLHDYVIGLSIIVLMTTGVVICLQVADSWMWGAFADYPALEFVWSFFPILILLAIGIPGLLVLYRHETESVGSLTVKVTGHQ